MGLMSPGARPTAGLIVLSPKPRALERLLLFPTAASPAADRSFGESGRHGRPGDSDFVVRGVRVLIAAVERRACSL